MYNLHPGMAKLKEITFPEKRWNDLSHTTGDERKSSLNAGNLEGRDYVGTYSYVKCVQCVPTPHKGNTEPSMD